MQALLLKPTDQVFTHRDPDTGEFRHFNASEISRAITRGDIVPVKVKAKIPTSLAKHLEKNGGIEKDGLERAASRINVPILIAEFDDGQSMIIDGNHRTLVRYQLGYDWVYAYVLSQEQWTPYLLTDFPPGLEEIFLKSAGFI